MSMFPYGSGSGGQGHPFMRSGNWFDWPTPNRIFEQNFGDSLSESDPYFREMQDRANYMMRSMGAGGPMSPPYWMRPASSPRTTSADRAQETGVSEVVCDKNEFKVNLDVKHFKPEELTVKTVDNTLTVEGKHEEKQDEHGFIQRHFVRKYVLPKGVSAEAVTSSLSPEGVLVCKAPMKAITAPGERSIPITPQASNPAVENK